MKVSGTASLHGTREAVWQALNDPAVLVRTIPGCHRLEALGDDTYAMTVQAGVAAIQGLYEGQVRLAEPHAPESYLLLATGAGAAGTVDARVEVQLHEAGETTEVSYAADATVGGMVGGVGQRMLAAVAKRLAAQFFTAVDGIVTGTASVAEAPTAPASPVTATRVFEAPATPARGVVGSPSFVQGAAVGTVAALVGAIVGGWISSRRRR